MGRWMWMRKILQCEMIRKSYSNRNARCPCCIEEVRARRYSWLQNANLVWISSYFARFTSESSTPPFASKMRDQFVSIWVFPANIIFIWMFYNLLFSSWFTMLVPINCRCFFSKVRCQMLATIVPRPQQYGAPWSHSSELEKGIPWNQPHHRRPDPICMKMNECLQRNTSPTKCVLLSIETHSPSTYKSRIIYHSEFDKQRHKKKPR